MLAERPSVLVSSHEHADVKTLRQGPSYQAPDRPCANDPDMLKKLAQTMSVRTPPVLKLMSSNGYLRLSLYAT